MNYCQKDKPIFKKIKTDYKKIWQSEKPFENFRQYFKNKAKIEGTGLWWIEDELSKNINDLPKVQIQFFAKLPKERRNYLISKSWKGSLIIEKPIAPTPELSKKIIKKLLKN